MTSERKCDAPQVNASIARETVREGFRIVREGSFCRVTAFLCFAAMCAMGWFTYRAGVGQTKALNEISMKMDRVVDAQEGYSGEIAKQNQDLAEQTALLRSMADNLQYIARNRAAIAPNAEYKAFLTGKK